MRDHKAVVLVSGGIDSAVCLGMASQEFAEIIPVHIQYGQQTDEVERKMAYNQCEHLSNEYPKTLIHDLRVVDYSSVFAHFPGGVADEGKSFDHMEEDDGRSSGYVPMRNLHFIATAAGIADVENAKAVYHGAQAGDDADYPDCRPEFMSAAARAIGSSVPHGDNIHLMNPILHKDKVEVLVTGERLGVNFAATYSCYSETDIAYPDPCGECPACIERAEAFDEAGMDDPYETEVAV